MIKVKTGISGLDKMLNGGLIAGRPYLLSGEPGAGKSIFGMQFLMQAVKEGKSGIYVTLEERKSGLEQNFKVFGWDINKIHVIEATPELGNNMWEIKADASFINMTLNMNNLTDAIKERLVSGAERIVMDSVTTMKLLYPSEVDARREILSLIHFLTDTQCTSLLLAEKFNEERTMESFLADGSIELRIIEEKGIKKRAIEVKKMRGTDFDEQWRPMKITNEGIIVYADEALFKP
jgi:KaiC/GvpD/RAD55 family RecA-like ATPase